MQKTLLIKNLEQIITDKNSKAIYNDGKIITADKFQYNKNENILNANGNVKVEDKVQNYLILQKILLIKNLEQIITDKNSKAIYNDGKIITADKFQYNKNENILNANGNVKVEDKVQNYLIFAEDITYKNLEQIITDKNSKAIYNDGKIITADKFQYNKNENILNANGNVKVEDKVQNYLIFAEDITYKKI